MGNKYKSGFFLIKLLRNSYKAISNSYDWHFLVIIFSLFFSVSVSFVFGKLPSSELNTISFGICSVIGIYISMAIAVLIQINGQAEKLIEKQHVEISEEAQVLTALPRSFYVSKNYNRSSIVFLQNIYHLLVFSVCLASISILLVILALNVSSVISEAVKPFLSSVNLPIQIKTLGLQGCIWHLALFFLSLLSLVYYLIIRNVYYLLSIDSNG